VVAWLQRTFKAASDRVAAGCVWAALNVPVLPIGLGLVGGIWLDKHLPLGWVLYLLAFALSGAAILASFRILEPRACVTAVGAIALASAAVGGLRHQVTYWRVSNTHILRHLDGEETFARLRGIVLTRPAVTKPSYERYGSPGSWGRRTRFTLAAEQILLQSGWSGCEGLLRVTVAEPALQVRQGDRIEIFAKLHRIPAPRNPGQYDWQTRYRRYGVYVSASVERAEAVRRLAGGGTGRLRGLLDTFRQRCRAALLDGIDADRPEASLLAAMVAGQRSAVSRTVDEAFRRSGTAHLLAVSGMHVGMIAGAAWLLGWLLLGRPKRAALAALAAVALYAAFVEPRAPAMRASVMAALAVAAVLTDRPFNAANWLATSAVVLLLLRPSDLFLPGFQLSFVVVAALILLRRTVHRFLFGPRNLAGWVRRQVQQQSQSLLRRVLITPLQHALSTSVTAWAGAMPLLAHHFCLVNPYAALATLLMLPLAIATVVLGFCKIVLGLAIPSLGAGLGSTVSFFAGITGRLAATLGSPPGSTLQIVPPPAWLVFTGYAVMGLWAWLDRRRWAAIVPNRTNRAAADPADASAAWMADEPQTLAPTVEAAKITQPIPTGIALWATAAVLVAYVLHALPAPPPAGMRVHVLSIGNGLAVVVRSPNGRNLLYDCGSLSLGSPARSAVIPALQKLGIRRIHAAVLSHANLDHYNGLAALARSIRVDRVLLHETFLAAAKKGLARRLLRDLAAMDVPIETITAGDRIVGFEPLQLEVLWPPERLTGPPLDVNDASVVLGVRFAGRTALLTGDIRQYPKLWLAERYPEPIRADLLLLPHHGSAATLTEQFLQRVGPDIAVASTADTGRAARIRRLLPTARVLETDSCGMITVDFSAESIRTSTWLATSAAGR